MARYYEVVSSQPFSEKTALLSKSKLSLELDLLNKADRITVQRVEKCCSYDQVYKIIHNNQVFYKVVQENHCCSQAYEDVFFFDSQERPIAQIQRTEICGYLSTSMTFKVSSPPGNCIGEIHRKKCFLERDQFEIEDFDRKLSIISVDETHYLSTVSEKLANVKGSGNVYEIHFKAQLTPVEKINFICYVVLLDLIKQEGIR